MEVTEIEEAYARLAPLVRVVMPLEKKGAGMTEFAFLDPDGTSSRSRKGLRRRVML
ncbi:MAG: hypothetical protein IPL75_13415 [Acidobacteria bacterium]|nr:hypothetical protein [Acidobacteriota bacterium]